MKIEIKIDPTCEETSITITAQEMNNEVSELLKSLSNQGTGVLVGFRDDSATMLDTDDIIRIYAAVQKIFVVTAGGEYTARLRLYELEDQLPNTFVRTSNSEIINLKKVRDFDLSFSGRIGVRFLDGSSTFVSRRYVAKVRKKLGL